MRGIHGARFYALCLSLRQTAMNHLLQKKDFIVIFGKNIY